MTILRALRKRAWIVILLFLLHSSQDAFGNRVSKTVTNTGGTTTTQYLVEDDVNPTGYSQVLDELTGPIGSAAVQRTYTYGLQRISQDQYISGWVLSYYQYDGAGSVRQLTSSTGQVTDSYEYDAFGNSFTKVGTTPNNYLYRGEQYDPDLGLYYLRARYYNPATGRFLSRDPEDGNVIDPKTLHKYLYVGADPINWIDPRGREDQEEYVMFSNEIAVGTTAEVTDFALAITDCFIGIAATVHDISEHGLNFWNGAAGTGVLAGCILFGRDIGRGYGGGGEGGGSGGGSGGGDGPHYGPGSWGPTPPYGSN